jgi:hypothetical protein
MFCGVELFIACFGVVLCGMLIFFFVLEYVYYSMTVTG